MTHAEPPSKTAVVTGANSGIGLATAVALAKHGFRVFAGVRTPDKAERLRVAATGLPLDIVQLDVTDAASVQAAFETATRQAPLDVLVNNAGIGGATPLEFTTDAEHRLMFETNYFGAVRCIMAALPSMRERRSGTIVNVTSISGLFPWPNQICYAASKWALEAVGAGLAHEVRRFGIRVLNVEPGTVETEIFENSKGRTRYDKDSPYRQIMRRNGKLIAAGMKDKTTPGDVAAVVLDAVKSSSTEINWPVGKDARTIASRRHTAPMDQWVALGGDVADSEYNEWFAQHLGIAL